MSDVRRGADAFRTVTDDRTTVHGFSFGSFYDPAHLGFGPMVCHNDDRVSPGGGYQDHPHSDLEIVTWVLEGELLHSDDAGRVSLGAGTVQVTSAGKGIRHAEIADPASGLTRFVQVWLRPDTAGGVPRTTRALPEIGDLTRIAGGDDLPVGVKGAQLYVGRPRVGVPLTLPSSALLHVYVARGSLETSRACLAEGDAWRLRDAGGVDVVPGEGTELLVWAFSRERPDPST